ncbi:MAG: hypothetical protein ACD_87C00273G0004 [uncultured bacterium]|nr:MAG: hypothetical protein ACD_87C00273G0004 [uncultured bacterium]
MSSTSKGVLLITAYLAMLSAKAILSPFCRCDPKPMLACRINASRFG